MQNAPFKLFEQIKDQLEPGKLFIEIGSDRGGGSTYFLYNLSKETNNDFVTVDLDPIYLNSLINAKTMSGEEFIDTVLPTIQKKVSLVFMDGFDWTFHPTDVRSGAANADTFNLISEYAKKGLILNNVNSSLTHLKQVVGMLSHLDDKCIFMFCDTWFNYTLDTFEGKGAGAVYLLLAEGFKIISASSKTNYIMMSRGINRNTLLPNLDTSVLSQICTNKQPPNKIMYVNDN